MLHRDDDVFQLVDRCTLILDRLLQILITLTQDEYGSMRACRSHWGRMGAYLAEIAPRSRSISHLEGADFRVEFVERIVHRLAVAEIADQLRRKDPSLTEIRAEIAAKIAAEIAPAQSDCPA